MHCVVYFVVMHTLLLGSVCIVCIYVFVVVHTLLSGTKKCDAKKKGQGKGKNKDKIMV